jgi:hypothetical protein
MTVSTVPKPETVLRKTAAGILEGTRPAAPHIRRTTPRQETTDRATSGVGHVLRLTFDAPAPAAEFDATLVTTP